MNYKVKLATTSILTPFTYNTDLQFIRYKNITNPIQIDGIDLLIGDIILIKDQIEKKYNGIYKYVKFSSGYHYLQRTRESLFITQESLIIVMDGDTNKDTIFTLKSIVNYTLDATDSCFIQVGAGINDINESDGVLMVSKGGTGTTSLLDDGILRGNGTNQIESIKSVWNSNIAPMPSNDNTQGYEPGSRWLDTTGNREYVCLDASTGAAIWTETTAGASGGESNTASNIGVGGVGLFKQKNGVDLQFKNINAGSNKINIIDNVANDEVDIDINLNNLQHGDLSGLNNDDHIQYALLNGRNGGQTLNGGTLANQNLNLSSTINATKGNVIIDGLSYPNTDGTVDQVLKTDGMGNLSFASVDLVNMDFVTTTPAETKKVLSTIPTSINMNYLIDAHIIAKKNDGTESGGYVFKTLFQNSANTLTKVAEDKLSLENALPWDANFIINSTNILLEVEGGVGITVEWKSSYKITTL